MAPERTDTRTGLTYVAAGVDVEAGAEAVRRIADAVRSTYTDGVVGDIGGFAGLFRLPTTGWNAPLLVSSTDGVGTKALVASAAGRYDTIGIDLVAMCADDVVCTGARPLFLLDYLAVGRLEPAVVERIVGGIATGCRQAGMALLGGEMAEHPGTMPDGAFDLAGFAVGAAEEAELWGPDRVRAGDVLVGLHSPGLRCNGYSLARRCLLEEAGMALDAPAWEGSAHTVADELLRPSVIYAPAVAGLPDRAGVHAVAHVTGGGIEANLTRAMPPDCDAVVEVGRWPVPRIFLEVQRAGHVEEAELRRACNIGLGMVLAVARAAVDDVLGHFAASGYGTGIIGDVVPGDGRAVLAGAATIAELAGPDAAGAPPADC